MSNSSSLLTEALSLGLDSVRPLLPMRQRQVLRRILACGSGKLGARLCECLDCGGAHAVPLSCRDRHCPRCQLHKSIEWLERQKEALLPVPYFHLVFTLPHRFNALIRQNPKCGLDLLFDAASSTLLDFGRNNLDAQLGMSAVLHTWGQRMSEHYHVHLIVTGGGLSLSEDEWIEAQLGKASGRWLFSTGALSKVFRARYLEGLRRLYENGELEFYGAITHWGEERIFSAQLRTASRRKWHVYAKAPFSGPEQVLRYLSLYTHRVAISERRMVKVDAESKRVHFRYKNNARNGEWEPISLEAAEFTRRFALHILPRSFCKIRHYGILSTRNRRTKIAISQVLLGRPIEEVLLEAELIDGTAETEPSSVATQATAITEPCCPFCGSTRLIVHGRLLPAGTQRGPPLARSLSLIKP